VGFCREQGRGDYRREAEGAENGNYRSPAGCRCGKKGRSKQRPYRQSLSLRRVASDLLQCTLIAGDAGYPGDAYQTVFYLDVYDIAGGEAVEIAAIYRDAFEAMACAPGIHD